MGAADVEAGQQVILDDVVAAVFVGVDENGGSSGRVGSKAVQMRADAMRRRYDGCGRGAGNTECSAGTR